MGSSKYEFNPEQFDIDVANNKTKYLEKKQQINEVIELLIKEDPSRMRETFSLIIDILKEIKSKYKL